MLLVVSMKALWQVQTFKVTSNIPLMLAQG